MSCLKRTPFNALGLVNISNLRSWTKSSVECYYNGMQCKKCVLAEDLKAQCKMKPIVLELVKKFGKPKKGLEWNEEERK